MSNFQIIDQEIIHASINGVRYGGKPRLLARTQDHLLVWVPGYTSYVNRASGRQYSRSAMVLFERRTHGAHGSKEICSGSRLSLKTFRDNADAIDAVMGEGFHELLEPNKTVVVGDNLPFSTYGNEVPITRNTFGYAEYERQKKRREELVAQGLSGIELEMAIMER